MNKIAEQLEQIQSRIHMATQAAGRAESDVRLIAVSKFHSQEAVQEAIDAGQRLFGENRVQEAAAKFPPLRAAHPDLELHLIGPLQTNKADDAVKLFDVIETLDRPQLVEALAKSMQKLDRHPSCYIEINIGNEPQKAGIAPEQLGEFLALCRSRSLNVTGLMCIPPQGEDPRPFFKAIKKMADEYKLPHLSMGMSADYEMAIAAGATEIRLGTAIFGERK